MEEGSDVGRGTTQPQLFVVIANISKRCNIRSLIASAVAFGAEVLVGETNQLTFYFRA